MILDVIGVAIVMAGFVIGLGAVTVIDIHGLLGRKSPYWTEATIRTHKVTKPMIWVGITLVALGGVIVYRNVDFIGIPAIHTAIILALIANGVFLSFYISPLLLKREAEGNATTPLPASLQKKIIGSLVVSDLGWWGSLVLFAWFIITVL